MVNRILPVDKIYIVLYTSICWYKNKFKLSKTIRHLILVIFTIPTVSFIINFPNSSIQIFYPSFFLLGALLGSTMKINPIWIRNIIFINIILGFIAVIFSYLGYENDFSFSLREKALPFIYAPYGLSPTQQVFGTLCILALIISFEYKKFDLIFTITLLATLSTLNRCTLLFFFLILFLYKKKIFYTLSSILILTFLYYWDIISRVLFSTSTIDSRYELRKGAEISFWQSGELITYLFGKGNSNTTEEIAAKTLYGRTYIEHGLDFIFHCYGYLGSITIITIIIIYLYYLIKNKLWRYFYICCFYILFEQLFTHELLASSFFFFFLTIQLLIQRRNSINYQYKSLQ